MTQDFQAIGKASPDVERVAAERQGWQGQRTETLIGEITDESDFSPRSARANQQALGRTIDNMAGHTETPAAAQPVRPYNPHPEES